jgi:hypothetical protein
LNKLSETMLNTGKGFCSIFQTEKKPGRNELQKPIRR